MINGTLAEQVIIKILAKEMGLTATGAPGAGANIWIRNQNVKIPDRDGLFVIVGLVDTPTVLAAENYIEEVVVVPDNEADPVITQQWEIIQSQMRENIMVDLISRDNSALTRRADVVMALASIYCQQQQEANAFRIFPRPIGPLNTSAAEGGSMLNRFTLTIPCLVWYKNEKLLTESGGDYYDDFTTRVDDANTIGTETGLIEFQITPDTPEP